MDLSVVVPIYNEEESLEALIQETNEVLRALGKDCEIIIVDDGSTDGTYPILIRLFRKEPRLKVVRLKRNFGQTAAVAAGLAYAQGEVIVAMDGDGQNDPRDIPRLIQKLYQGYDVVSGWRYKRQDSVFTTKQEITITARTLCALPYALCSSTRHKLFNQFMSFFKLN